MRFLRRARKEGVDKRITVSIFRALAARVAHPDTLLRL
jgi:hypothetical protein